LVHSEMPEQEEGRMRGFQLWVNLPARLKMTEPRYQEFAPERIPVVRPADGLEVKVVAGRVGDVQGPIDQPATEPVYLDVSLSAGAAWEHVLPEGHNAFACVFEGRVSLGAGGHGREMAAPTLAVLEGGPAVRLQATAAEPARVLLVAGRPIGEPVARHGPFVMNTQQELVQAFQDYQAGRFCARPRRPPRRYGAGALPAICRSAPNRRSRVSSNARCSCSPVGAWNHRCAMRPSGSLMSVSRAAMSGWVAISARYHCTSKPPTCPVSSRFLRCGSNGDSSAM